MLCVPDSPVYQDAEEAKEAQGEDNTGSIRRVVANLIQVSFS